MKASMEPIYFLLVDDLEENLVALDALLRRDDRVMLKARSGTEALELLLKYDVALALIDVQMPGMDGFELAELMRGAERTRHVAIIFLTAGNADYQRKFQGYEAGGVDFLQKPVESNILTSKAEIFSELHRQRLEVTRQRDELKVATEEITRLLDESRSYAAALKIADQRKDEFLATLAHELRNPLSPISSAITLIGEHVDNPDEVRELTAIASRQVKQLVRLVDDLLDVSRIRLGKIELQRRVFPLSQVIDQALEATRQLIQDKGHRIQVGAPSQPVHLDGDPVRMTQILTNLLNNAAKYTPPGGMIGLKVTDDNQQVTVEITDNGIGIPLEKIQDVFDIFTQVGHLSERSGLGIGLALVKQLVELHNGTVTIRSEGIGRGSTVTVCLPVVQPAGLPDADSSGSSGEQPAAPVPNFRVLIVDDLPSNTSTLGRLIEKMGHTVATANDGPTALARIAEFHPEIVISDISMPGMSGYELAAEIRKQFGNEVCLVAMTGYGMQKDKDQALESGFDQHMVKPPDYQMLKRFFESLSTAS